MPPPTLAAVSIAAIIISSILFYGELRAYLAKVRFHLKGSARLWKDSSLIAAPGSHIALKEAIVSWHRHKNHWLFRFVCCLLAAGPERVHGG